MAAAGPSKKRRIQNERYPITPGLKTTIKCPHLEFVRQKISLKKGPGEGEEFREGTVPLNTSHRKMEARMVNGRIQKTIHDYKKKGLVAKKPFDDKFIDEKLMDWKPNDEEASGEKPIENELKKAISNEFLIDEKWQRKYIPLYPGKKMVAGHLGSKNLGQRGSDENLILMTNACNSTYYHRFEKHLENFVQDVGKEYPNLDASVQVDYYIPKYVTLKFQDKDDNEVELPFAPKFIVQFTLIFPTVQTAAVDKKKPAAGKKAAANKKTAAVDRKKAAADKEAAQAQKKEVTAKFDKAFKSCGSPKTTVDGNNLYTLEFTNGCPSELAVDNDFIIPAQPENAKKWESVFTSEL